MLDKLSVEDFAPLIGDPFVVDLGEAGRFDFKLADAYLFDADGPTHDASGVRSPFVLRFHGPPDPVFAQAIYPLEHVTAGMMEIFIVPIGRDDESTQYEAIFA